jgi:hypothetical protein
VKLERLDDGRYRLETMSGQSITCSEQELLRLATLADSHRDQLQQLSSRGGLVTTNISRVIVSIDAHHTEVILQKDTTRPRRDVLRKLADEAVPFVLV